MISLQVNELPFPFANADQFESLIQQPLGREWNPETAFRRLNQPKVRTRIGVRIDPLNKDEVFVKKNRSNPTDKDPFATEPDQGDESLFDHEPAQKKKKFSKKKN